jgi:carbonic anhydrase
MKDMPRALFEGYIAFKYGRFRTERARYRELADTGQKPELMVIGCCDSRAAPEVIFDAVPGQVFTVRNVANLVPPYDPDGEFHGTSAALEYAVQALHVKHILVLGHARCGGIAASLARDTNPLTRDDFIGKWISMVDAARGDLEAMDPPAENRIETLEKLSIIRSLANLRTFPCIQSLEPRGEVHLHGAYFDIESGELSWFDKQSQAFKTVEYGMNWPMKFGD